MKIKSLAIALFVACVCSIVPSLAWADGLEPEEPLKNVETNPLSDGATPSTPGDDLPSWFPTEEDLGTDLYNQFLEKFFGIVVQSGSTGPGDDGNQHPQGGDQKIPIPEPAELDEVAVQSASEWAPEVNKVTAQKFIDRANLRPFAVDLYNILVEASDNDGNKDYLIQDKYADTANLENYVLTYNDLKKDTVVTTSTGAKAISLGPVKVTNIANKTTGGALSAEAKILRVAIYSQMKAAITAFDRDHPEVFWHGVEHLVGMYVDSSTETCYPLYYLSSPRTSTDGYYDFRDPALPNESAIKAKIKEFNAGVDTILQAESTADGPLSTPYQKVRFFHDWLVFHNEYNTIIGGGDGTYVTKCLACHAAFGAILGGTGANGPICEAYARAMKVLCDRSGVPCCLSSGVAKSGPTSAAEGHMWCLVQLQDNRWYAVDPTWDDPMAASTSAISNLYKGAITTLERRAYLCLGANTYTSTGRDALTFRQERPNPTNALFETELHFTNEPEISSTAFVPTNPSTKINNSDSRLKINLGWAYEDSGKSVLPNKIEASFAGTNLRQNIDYVVDGYDNTKTPEGGLKFGFMGAYTNMSESSGNSENRISRAFWIFADKDDKFSPCGGGLGDGGDDSDSKDTYYLSQTPTEIYSGSQLRPKIHLMSKQYGRLVENRDYKVTYGENINAGKGTITVTGIAPFNFTQTFDFTILPKPIEEVSFSGVLDQYNYAGEAIMPVPRASFANKDLKSGTDYEISYTNNTDVTNMAVVTITGKGNYSGSKQLVFKIVPVNISAPSVRVGTIPERTFTGSAIQPSVKITFNNKALSTPKDYSVAYINNISAGKAQVRISGNGNFSGERVLDFTIAPANISDAKMTLSSAPVIYTGEAQTINFALSFGDYVLSDSDYDVAWDSNVNVGRATATLTGKGNFEGNRNFAFDIKAATILDSDVSLKLDNATYTGQQIIPQISVSHGGKALQPNSDYSATVTNNVSVGEATVKVEGKGNYTGIVEKHFQIQPFDISNIEVKGVEEKYVWSASGNPDITPVVEALGKQLVLNDDYNVTFEFPDGLGKGKVTIVGKGNFSGTIEKEFEIVAPESGQSDIPLTAEDKVSVQYVWFSCPAKDIAVSISNPKVCEVDVSDLENAITKVATTDRSMKKVTTTAIGAGEADITLKGKNSTETYSYSVKVASSPTWELPSPSLLPATVILSENQLDFELGKSETRTVTISGEGSNDLSIETKPENIVEAKLDKTTLSVTPLAEGSAKITVTRAANDAYVEAKATLTVSVTKAKEDHETQPSPPNPPIDSDGGQTEDAVDTTKLADVIKAAEALKQENYTEDSWTSLSGVLSEAKALLQSASEGKVAQTDVDAMQQKLQAAIDALVTLPLPKVDTSNLENAIADAEKLTESNYTDASWAAFSIVLSDAKSVVKNASEGALTQADVDSMLTKLLNAIQSLEEKEQELPPMTDSDNPNVDDSSNPSDDPTIDDPNTPSDTPSSDDPQDDPSDSPSTSPEDNPGDKGDGNQGSDVPEKEPEKQPSGDTPEANDPNANQGETNPDDQSGSQNNESGSKNPQDGDVSIPPADGNQDNSGDLNQDGSGNADGGNGGNNGTIPDGQQDESALDLLKLQELVDSLSMVEIDKYTQSSAKAFVATFAEASEMLKNPGNATQAQVDLLVTKLQGAYDNLKPIEDASGNRVDGDSTQSADDESTDKSGSNGFDVPRSGSSSTTGTTGGTLNQLANAAKGASSNSGSSTSSGTGTSSNVTYSQTPQTTADTTGASTSTTNDTTSTVQPKLADTGVVAIVLPTLAVSGIATLLYVVRRRSN